MSPRSAAVNRRTRDRARIPFWEDDDDDGAAPLPERKVQIENRYFEKLTARLKQQRPDNRPANPLEPTGEAEENRPDNRPEDRPAGPVIYNDDGSVYKKPVR